MKATIEADGEDLVVTLPQELIDDLRLKPGDEIEIEVDENGIARVTAAARPECKDAHKTALDISS